MKVENAGLCQEHLVLEGTFNFPWAWEEEYLKTNSSPLKINGWKIWPIKKTFSKYQMPTLIRIWKPKSKRMNLSCDAPKIRTPIYLQTEMSLPLTVATWMLVEWLASPLCRGRCHTTLEQKNALGGEDVAGVLLFFFGGRRKNMYTPFFFGRGGRGKRGEWRLYHLKN